MLQICEASMGLSEELKQNLKYLVAFEALQVMVSVAATVMSILPSYEQDHIQMRAT